ncbi:pesticin C-terminus-like muramidase, partial [Aeromonas cavernicola]
EIRAALADENVASQIRKLFICHESEWIKRPSWPRLEQELKEKPNLYQYALTVNENMNWIDDSAIQGILGDSKPWFIHPAGMMGLVGSKAVEKPIIFPLRVKPENDQGKVWGDKYWAKAPSSNAATFKYPRDNGSRRHAARDLYTKAYEEVIAVCDGKVLDVSDFYLCTWEIVIHHKTSDGREFIMRYGEVDPAKIKVKTGDIVKQGQLLGVTGLLLKSDGTHPVIVQNATVYMLHVEIYTGANGMNINSPLTNSHNPPFMRRSDLVDSIDILQEGYINSFGEDNTNNEQPASLKINFDFIRELEGGMRLDGYVPNPESSDSGVTISVGFYLGARNISDLNALSLGNTLINKLSPYLGKKKFIARDFLIENPLSITHDEGDKIREAIENKKTSLLVARYNSDSTVEFQSLSKEAQTVIASVEYQYGYAKTETPNFWQQVTQQNWQGAIDILRDFRDDYPTRRNKEADYLEGSL